MMEQKRCYCGSCEHNFLKKENEGSDKECPNCGSGNWDFTGETVVELGCYGIEVVRTDAFSYVKSDLKEKPIEAYLSEGLDDLLKYDAMINMLESLILAHYNAGIDVTKPDYLEGIKTAIDAFTNNS